MKREEVRTGQVLRVVAEGLGTPLGALATIDSIDTTPNNTFCINLTYHEKRPSKRGYLYRSCLWEADFGLVEIVEAQSGSSNHGSAAKRRMEKATIKRRQMTLPFENAKAITFPRGL